MVEIDAVARKKGIGLPENIIEETFKTYDGLRPEGKPSMVRDLEHGNRLELDALNGIVVRLGKELNVPTPVNQFIYAALKLHAGGT